MTVIRASIDVDGPVSDVYALWNEIERFPEFMDHVVEVDRIDGTRARWVAEIAGVRREWTSRVTEQVPNERISWVSEGGEEIGGSVQFEALIGDRARIHLGMEFEPQDALEHAGDTLGILERRIRKDLERFKGFVEARPRMRETG